MMRVDWTKPIEAVHEDGRVVAASRSDARHPNGRRWVYWKDNAAWFGSDGIGSEEHDGWRIRNVAQPAGETAARSPEIVVRMEAILWDAVNYFDLPDYPINHPVHAFRAILAELEPVDGDLVEARNVLVKCGWVDDDASYDAAREVALEALKRGRELERGA